MNFIKLDGESLVFHLNRREKEVLVDLLRLYPLVPSSHHRLSKSAADNQTEANQRLLEEALAEQRRENKEQLQAMLADPQRFLESASGHRLKLTQHEMEWLLQVLNDIRVGSWLILGSPDEKKGGGIKLKGESEHYLWAMELCGYFQSVILEALSRPNSAA